jgi:hypothetical protein
MRLQPAQVRQKSYGEAPRPARLSSLLQGTRSPANEKPWRSLHFRRSGWDDRQDRQWTSAESSCWVSLECAHNEEDVKRC